MPNTATLPPHKPSSS